MPSSSIRRASPRAGGGCSASTDVRGATAPPTSAADFSSCGFFFAPMIPFSDGYRGTLIASDTATTAGSGARIVS